VIPASHFAAIVVAIIVLAAVVIVIAVMMLVVAMAVLVGQTRAGERHDHCRTQPQPSFALHLAFLPLSTTVHIVQG
jgi:uncharacterized membrane protein